jgi:hypothetical protein
VFFYYFCAIHITIAFASRNIQTPWILQYNVLQTMLCLRYPQVKNFKYFVLIGDLRALVTVVTVSHVFSVDWPWLLLTGVLSTTLRDRKQQALHGICKQQA